MNRKTLSCILIIALIIVNSISVFATSEYTLSISTNTNRVKLNRNIVLTGTVLKNNEPAQGIVATVKVENSEGTTITYIDQIETDESGGFEVTINTNSTFYQYGDYIIYVKAAGIQKTTTFEVYKSTSSGGEPSGGGSSGGGSEEGQEEKETEQGKATVTKDEEGNVTVTLEIDTDKVEDQIEKEESDKVEINAVVEEDAYQVTVTMEDELVFKINESGKKLSINTGDAVIEIEPDSFDIEEGIKVNLKVSKLNESEAKGLATKVESEEYNPAGNILDLELTIVKDNEESKVQFKKSVTVAINYDKSKVKDTRKLGAYYYNEEEEKWEYVGGKADSEGKVVFTVEHFSKYTVMEYNRTFADIDIPWAKDAIEVLAARHVIDGVDKEHYAPNNNISRAAFAKLIVNALNLKPGDNAVTFTDVEEGQWYTEPVNTAASLGIVTGYDGKFNPKGEITREAMATMIVRALKHVSPEKDYTQTTTTFEDREQVADWAKEAVGIAYNKGIVNGVNETTFAPKDNATRAHAAVMIYRMLEVLDLL